MTLIKTNRIAALMRKSFLAASVLALGLTVLGCGDDTVAEPPTARVVFQHDVSDLPGVEILVDGAVLTTVQPGDRTAEVQVPLGSHDLGVGLAGASTGLYMERFDFAEQLYYVAIRGTLTAEPDNPLTFWKVDAVAPAVSATETAVEVVNLSSVAQAFDVYVGDTLVAEGSNMDSPDNISPFTNVPSGSASVKVRNAGDEPTAFPVATSDTVFEGGGATMILVGGSPTDGLNITYLKIK